MNSNEKHGSNQFLPGSLKPYQLLLLSAFVCCFAVFIILILLSLVFSRPVVWIEFSILFVFVFFTIYAVFAVVFKYFIFEKIKQVYKTILQYKLPGGTKIRQINLHEDIIAEVNADVREWAEQRKSEIDNLKNLEAWRREFLVNIAHELKTPVFNIQGYVSTLLGGAIDDSAVNREFLEKTGKNIERLILILDDLDIITQLESSGINMHYSRFNIAELTAEVFDLLENNALQKNISLTFLNGTNVYSPFFVWADRERIQQVLINLIDNSIKYGVEGGNTKVGFHDLDENILVEISDNGIGIDQIHLPRLFERFYRVDKSRSRKQGGSGLGLAIVKHIVEAHNQTINVRSTPQIGSAFSFTLKNASDILSI